MSEELIKRLRRQADIHVNCKSIGLITKQQSANAMLEAADRIEALTAERDRYRKALATITDGTFPRPLGEPWRMDLTSSKHDRCVHGAWMYEPCEGCIDAFVAATLAGDKA